MSVVWGRFLAGLLLVASSAVVTAGVTSAAASGPVRCEGRVVTIGGTPGHDRIVGTPGDDVIAALDGGDWVDGRGGDDLLCGGDGADTLRGGAGDDRLLGGGDGTFPDTHCSAGRRWTQGDRLLPGPGDDYVDGGYDSRQRSPCGAQPDSVSFRDSPAGIRAMLGDPGRPGVVRSAGDRDAVVGERSLEVQGSRYDDRIRGGRGDEVLRGNGGADTIIGGAGDDSLRDEDYRSGPAAGDRLEGGAGADNLTSWRGPDELAGGEDDDIVGIDLSCSTVAGGPGSDEAAIGRGLVPDGTVGVAFDAAAGTVAVLPAQPACGRFTELESYDLATGSAPADFRGTDGPEVVRAFGAAGMTATTLGGDDVVTGTDGDDVIDAGEGVDQVDGALGRDVCIGAEAATSCDADSLPLPPPACDGKPATIVSAGQGGDLVGTPGDDVIVGSDYDDRIDALGGNDVICARAGLDSIAGGDGSDRIFAGEDHEYPEGGYIGDTVLPGPGDDVVDLGEGPGPDTLSYVASTSPVTAQLAPVGGTFTVAGEGTDTVTTHAPYRLWGSNLGDVVTGSSGDDWILGWGGDDVLDGVDGDDTLEGEGGCAFSGCGPADHDVLLGGEGDDVLAGGAGRDDFDAGPGDDSLTATSRAGVATMAGGTGADQLRVFARSAALRGHLDGGPDLDALGVVTYNFRESDPRVVVDTVSGRVRAGGLGDLITFAGMEAYDLDAYNTGTPRQPMIFRFLGSAADERVTVQRYGYSVLRALMRGGDDVVRATDGDDVIDAGAGFDVVRALRGDDVCRAVEARHGCER